MARHRTKFNVKNDPGGLGPLKRKSLGVGKNTGGNPKIPPSKRPVKAKKKRNIKETIAKGKEAVRKFDKAKAAKQKRTQASISAKTKAVKKVVKKKSLRTQAQKDKGGR